MLQGRAWEASELRLKNFKDLHTLWYIGAREQNLLATQKEEVRRMGVTTDEMQVSMAKIRNVRGSPSEFVVTLTHQLVSKNHGTHQSRSQRATVGL